MILIYHALTGLSIGFWKKIKKFFAGFGKRALFLRTTPIISQGDLIVKHFFKKNKKERELFFPLLSLKSHNLKTEIQKKINQKQVGVPLLK